MDLGNLVTREIPPAPWSEGDNIPWHDPAFSARMLREHLAQEHDLASRRTELIDAHVAWIHGEILSGKRASILDLGCGPGLYAHRLALLGHRIRGIDYSPASIDYARQHAPGGTGEIEFELADIRTGKYGSGFDLAMQIFGEFHVFMPVDAGKLLERISAALDPGGHLLLEMTALRSLEANCSAEPSWQVVEQGLFGDTPYLQLSERFWDAERKSGTHRYYIISLADGKVTRYASSYQGYTAGEITQLVAAHGFGRIEIAGEMGVPTPGFDSMVVHARRQ